MNYTAQTILHQSELSPVPHFRSNKSLLHPGSECRPGNAWDALRRHAEAFEKYKRDEQARMDRTGRRAA